MEKQGEKIVVPTYRMSQTELYLLLRIRMEQTGRKNINGVKKDFFEPATYKGGEKLLESLTKKNLLEQQEGNVLIGEGLERALEVVMRSAHCMCFQNETLQKKGQILSFYYAAGQYAGMLQDQKNSMLVCTPDREAVYMAFEDILEAKGISSAFQAEKWEKVYGEPIGKPVREALIVHSRNRVKRNRLTLAMLADKYRLYMMMGEDGQKQEEMQRDTQAAADWFGVVLRELERLKDGGDLAEGTIAKIKEPPGPKSEYRRIVESEGFPRTGAGFWFWCLKQMVRGIPLAFKEAVKKKFLFLLPYFFWAVALFLYNMYAACYINDTFMFERRARWGNLTPYLIAGTLQTPSSLKGLGEKWGLIDTVFLVWPMMMMLTLIGRHLILQIRSRKLAFLKDVVCIPRVVGECRSYGYGRSRQLWVPFLVTWVLGFVIMNPVTIFLAAVYCLLVFAQKDNAMIRFMMLWRSAAGRKGVEAGTRQEPRTEKYRLIFFHLGCGFLIYGLASLMLWHVVAYHFWIRLIVTMLMAILALLQIFWPGMLADPIRKRFAKAFLLSLIAGMAAAYFGSRYGIVLADDGGVTESGGWAGLLQNAGFSTIVGLTALTIGLAVGGPLGGLLAAGGVLGAAGTFAVGFTDTTAGDYVRMTSRQYFFGPEEGEKKTFYCTAAQVAGFIAGFLNPAAGTGGAATKLFYGGKVAGDLISMTGDAAATGKDIAGLMSGSGDVTGGDVLMDLVGLGLDVYGFAGDLEETGDILQDIKLKGADYKYEKGPGLLDQLEQMVDDRDSDLADARIDVGNRQQIELDAETARHSQKAASIQDSMQKLQNNQITPPGRMDSDTYKQVLNERLQTEKTLHLDALTQIRQKYGEEAARLEQHILDQFNLDLSELEDEVVADMFANSYDTYSLYENIKEYIETHKPDDTEPFQL